MQIILLGDSIAQGLGVAGCSYAEGVAAKLRLAQPETQITNLAGSAAQLSYSMTRLPEIVSWQPEIVIIAHGITEAIIRPVPSALRLLPRRWRQIGWLDPRPYFSRRVWKSVYQRSESAVRWRVKVQLIKNYGGDTLTSAEEFECLLAETVETLLRQTTAKIILLTHCGIDERYYPRSLSSLRHYQQRIERVAAELGPTERVHMCDVSCLLNQWSDFFADHFHPNAAGHRKIATAVYEVIEANAACLA